MKLTIAKWNEKEGAILEANGLIRVNANKPDYGSLMVLNSTIALSGGFANRKTRVGFINGSVEDLKATIEEFKLREGTDFSAAVGPHRIVTIEKTESEVGDELGYREKINPSTGEVLTSNGETIYWKTEVVAEGSNVYDKFVQHDTEDVDAAVEEFAQTEEVEEN
jgi:hypothetical protein